MSISTINLDSFIGAYREALAWSSITLDENGENIEGLEEYYYSESADWQCIIDCCLFLRENLQLVDYCVNNHAWYTYSQAGHDFALTRNRHGAGFWDRGLGDIGDALTKEAQDMGCVELFINTQGEIEIE